MIGLVLAAGKGSRLSPDGKDEVCKALVLVGGKPLISYSLDNLIRLGVRTALVVIGPQHQNIVQTLGNDYRGLTLHYVVQTQPIGLANAMLCARDLIDDDVVLQLSDEIFLQPCDASVLLKAYEEKDFLVGYTLDSEEKIRQNYSLNADENGKVLHCTEKPTQVENDRKGTGFCMFSAACFAMLKTAYDAETNRPADLCDFINLLIENGMNGTTCHIAEEEININTPAELRYAKQRLKQRG